MIIKSVEFSLSDTIKNQFKKLIYLVYYENNVYFTYHFIIKL